MPAGEFDAGDDDAADVVQDTRKDERLPRGGSGLRLASAVMLVTDLERSTTFYQHLLGWRVAISDDAMALLVGSEGFQLYLRGTGPRTQHPLGFVGIHYLMWTAGDEDDLARCERALRGESAHVTTTTAHGVTVIEGRGPDDVPILITYPGPEQLPRQEILQRLYAL